MAGTAAHDSVRIDLLGDFAVRAGDEVLLDRSWNRRKAKALLKLVALEPSGALLRDRALEALWPDLDPDAATNNLHKNLHYLRSALAGRGHAPVVQLRDELLRLAPDVRVDAAAFREAAERARASGSLDDCEAALTLYAGDLLPEDTYEEWTTAPREDLRARYVELLRAAADGHAARDRDDLAVDRLQRLVQADPLDEEAHRGLMSLYARAGSRHRALRQYQACRDALERDLGVTPSPETEELRRSIAAGADDIAPREPGPAQAPRTPPESEAPPAVFGRGPELEAADEALEEAFAGRGTTLCLAGEAGIGKSHLIAQVAAAARQAGALVLRGRSYEIEAMAAYQPLRDMLEQLRGEPEGDEATDLVRRSLYLRRLAPDVEPEAAPASDPALLQAELFGEVARLFGSLARRRPLLLAFDDLHAADSGSLRLVHFLARHAPEQRLLLLAGYRPEEVERRPELAGLLSSLRRDRLATEVPLARMDDASTALLVRDAFSDPVDEELVREVVARAGGNPLFAWEIVHTLIDEGWARFASGRWQRRGGGPAPLPGAVRDLVDRRLERLGDAAREELHVAAVFGRDVDYATLRHVVGLSERETLDGLDECIEAFILEETPEGYRFRHDLLREAVLARLTRARHRRLHRAVAEALAERPGGAADAETVGYHFAESDEPWRALPHLLESGLRTAAVFANEGAIAIYERALDIVRDHESAAPAGLRAEVLERLGDLKRRTGDVDASVALFEEAAAALEQAGDDDGAARVRGKAALGYIIRGDGDAATRHIQETLRTLTGHSSQHVVSRTYYLLAQLHWHSGEHREALEAAERALLAADEGDDPAHLAQAYEVLALACHSLGDWQRGVEYELSRQAMGVSGFDTDEAFDAHL